MISDPHMRRLNVQPTRQMGRPVTPRTGAMIHLRCKNPELPMSALGHVWTAPSWQGESSRNSPWSVQPCVRPLSAVHMTAGHNALRGSGPGQKDAFNDALARVGCPDRRRLLCFTCCSPSQPSHHAGLFGAIFVRPSAKPDSCTARPWPSLPKPFARAC